MKGMIGLEIHTYLTTKEKLFCNCAASREKGLQPNVNICPICTGQPGAKPMLPNHDALQKSIMIALMLGCKVNEVSAWQRKHYDWPDLPKGYQNTLSGPHAVPLGVNGKFEGIKIRSMHLEEDPASWEPSSGKIDYNRSGLPIVEIVTEPDFSFSDEVVEWLKKLVHSLAYLKSVDSNAGIKADVNVNIAGKTDRVEIKNINSLESIKKAIDYELTRQEKEGSVRETRRFDELKGKTISMRTKEKEDDYRFIADPDLRTLKIHKKEIEDIAKDLPEMPAEKLKKIVKKHSIDAKNAEILAKNIDVVELFENIVEKGKIDGKFALPWITVELMRVLNWNKKNLDEVDIEVEHFIKLLELVKSKKITELQAKQILNKFVPKSFDPSKTEGKIDDKNELEKIASSVIKENKATAEKYMDGDEKAINYLMGEIMKKTDRRADYKVALDVLKKLLK